jgi:hypothetical protein
MIGAIAGDITGSRLERFSEVIGRSDPECFDQRPGAGANGAAPCPLPRKADNVCSS